MVSEKNVIFQCYTNVMLSLDIGVESTYHL
jgi:hypothetical protein